MARISVTKSIHRLHLIADVAFRFSQTRRPLAPVQRMAASIDRDAIDKIARYKMPLIRLDRNNGRKAICLIFEKINVGGKKPDAFELLTAIFAASDFDLRRDWNGPVDNVGNGKRDRDALRASGVKIS